MAGITLVLFAVLMACWGASQGHACDMQGVMNCAGVPMQAIATALQNQDMAAACSAMNGAEALQQKCAAPLLDHCGAQEQAMFDAAVQQMNSQMDQFKDKCPQGESKRQACNFEELLSCVTSPMESISTAAQSGDMDALCSALRGVTGQVESCAAPLLPNCDQQMQAMFDAQKAQVAALIQQFGSVCKGGQPGGGSQGGCDTQAAQAGMNQCQATFGEGSLDPTSPPSGICDHFQGMFDCVAGALGECTALKAQMRPMFQQTAAQYNQMFQCDLSVNF